MSDNTSLYGTFTTTHTVAEHRVETLAQAGVRQIYGTLRGATYFLGVLEWITTVLLIWGYWNPKAGVVAAVLCVGTFISTVTTIPFLPNGWNADAGFPAMQGDAAFTMKDVVFLAVSVYLLKQDAMRAFLTAQRTAHYKSHRGQRFPPDPGGCQRPSHAP